MITLRDARISAGFSIEDAAKFVNISPKALTMYEGDNSEMKFSMFLSLCRLYKISADSVHVGTCPQFAHKFAKQYEIG